MKPLLIKIGKGLLCFFKKKYSIQKGLEALTLDLLDKYLKQQFQRVKDFGKHNKNINDRPGHKIFRICKQKMQCYNNRRYN